MAKLEGYKKVAVIKLGCIDYHYAIYDDGTDYKAGDRVLVSGGASASWNNTVISEIITAEEAHEKCKKNITAEVICKIDTSAYDKRVANRKEVEKLKKEMNKKISELDELNKYKYYAEQNPELEAMFNRLKELVES